MCNAGSCVSSVVALDSDGQQKIMIQSDRQRSPLLCPQAFFSTEPNQALCPALWILNGVELCRATLLSKQHTCLFASLYKSCLRSQIYLANLLLVCRFCVLWSYTSFPVEKQSGSH